MTKDNQLQALRTKLDPAHVKKVQNQSYVSGLYVVDKLNEVFGADGWSDTVVHRAEQFGTRVRQTKDGPREWTWCSCVATVRLEVRWADGSTSVHDGVGAGDGGNYQDDLAQVRDLAWKEAETDAVKRAARKLGYVFGLSLYDKDNPIHKGRMDSYGDLPPAVLIDQAARAAVARGADGNHVGAIIAEAAGGVVDPGAVPFDAAAGVIETLHRLGRAA